MWFLYDKITDHLEILCSLKRNYIEACKNLSCFYVKFNTPFLLKKLRKAVKKRKLNAAFLCYEPSKWKCQSLYELLESDKNFRPYILVSKPETPEEAVSPVSDKDLKDIYDFFKNKNMDVYYAYDIKKHKTIPIKKFKPDIIFYQSPWYVARNQNPVTASSFALTCYVPYFVTNVASEIEYGLRFHLYIHRHYILNELIKEFFSKRMENKGANLRVTGHPILDYFYLKNSEEKSSNSVIYAPHWSINYHRVNYATFHHNGKYILEFAKSHPEIKWIFKPHPALKLRLKTLNIMSEEEIENYWHEWDKLGLRYETGDYLKLFDDSFAMITDCASFLTEYFLTEKPLIHLVSKGAYEYNPSAKRVVENYYNVHNLEELEETLQKVVIRREDDMKEKRVRAISELGFKGVFASQNILNDLKKDLEIETK